MLTCIFLSVSISLAIYDPHTFFILNDNTFKFFSDVGFLPQLDCDTKSTARTDRRKCRDANKYYISNLRYFWLLFKSGWGKKTYTCLTVREFHLWVFTDL